MNVHPKPPDDAAPVASPETVELSAGEQATVTYEPEQSGSTFRIPVVAISKRPNSAYRVKMDDGIEWGWASIPPTDIDDMTAVWTPTKLFRSKLEVQVANVAESGTRDYHILPVGWETKQE